MVSLIAATTIVLTSFYSGTASVTDHSPALSTIPPQALKRGYEVEIDEIDNSEWKITLTKNN